MFQVWQYKVLWGKSASEVKKGINEGITNTTSYTVTNLEACQAYMFVVMIYGPNGIGPDQEIQVRFLLWFFSILF